MARPNGDEEWIVSDARAEILGRIERALRTGRIPDAAALDTLALGSSSERGILAVPQEAARALQASDGDRFIVEARALGIEVFVEWSADSVRDRLGFLVAGKRVLAWNPDRLPYNCGDLLRDAVLGAAPRAEQARAEVGVTACHGAIAETGSLALISGPGCSRTVSLLPPVHIALVRRTDLVASMGEFFAARADAMAQAANCTFITGPSRTADIELSLTIGVHGPGKVIIILGP